MWVSVEGSAAVAPCARGKHSATLLGGYVYVLGGRGAGGAVPLRDFWRYCLGKINKLQPSQELIYTTLKDKDVHREKDAEQSNKSA